MRRPMISGNWKMYKTANESVNFVSDIKKAIKGVDNVDIVVCPPFTSLSAMEKAVEGRNIQLGGQNCHWEEEGAFTGEISVLMLKSVGAEYVIIGHSERRKYFGETDETVNKKIKAAIEVGLVPIVCVGEILEEREAGKTLEVVKTQVEGALKGFDETYLESLIIAYEPVWAIGTGKTATPLQAEEVHKMIRDLLKELYSEGFASKTRILYGGSVKPDNIEDLMKEEDIDGGLIGGASLKADSFTDIILKTSKLYKNE